MDSHIILAYALDGNGGGEALAPQDILERVRKGHKSWIHLDANNPNSATWLAEHAVCTEPFVVGALLAEETRPRMVQIGSGALLILRGINLNADAEPEDMVSIRLWVEEDRVVSVWKRSSKAVLEIEERLLAGKGPRTVGEFVRMLSARLFARIETVFTTLQDATDDMEERVLETVDALLRESIVDVRKQAIVFRRYMAPQRDAIRMLSTADVDWLTETDRLHLQELYDQVTRHVEDLDAIRDRAQVVKDELANMITEKANKNVYMLSIIAAIFLPLGFLTGLLGINVGGIPGADNASAFWVFCSLLLGVIVGQLALFRRVGWL